MQGKGGLLQRYVTDNCLPKNELHLSKNKFEWTTWAAPAGKLFQALEELVSFALNYLSQSLCSFYLTRWRCLWQISIFVAWITLEIGNCRVNRKEKNDIFVNFADWLRKIYNFQALLQLIDHTSYLSSESKFSLFCLNFTTARNYSEKLFFVK